MKWTEELPKAEGWYLRTKPPCPGFQKYYLMILDVDYPHVKKGELGTNFLKVMGDMRRVSDLPKSYWYGPLPKLSAKQLKERI